MTASAVVIGGIWAYFKFVRGRTYRPRLSVDMAGQWRSVDGVDLLHLRIRVSNIGASKISLNQYGTGLQLSFPADEQDGPPNEVRWQKVPLIENNNDEDEQPENDGDVDEQPEHYGIPQARTFEIFKEHEWIEPGETVSDELLLNLGRTPTISMPEVTLMWSLSGRHHDRFSGKDIEVFARRIIPPGSSLIDNVVSSTRDKPESGSRT